MDGHTFTPRGRDQEHTQQSHVLGHNSYCLLCRTRQSAESFLAHLMPSRKSSSMPSNISSALQEKTPRQATREQVREDSQLLLLCKCNSKWNIMDQKALCKACDWSRLILAARKSAGKSSEAWSNLHPLSTSDCLVSLTGMERKSRTEAHQRTYPGREAKKKIMARACHGRPALFVSHVLAKRGLSRAKDDPPAVVTCKQGRVS